MKSIYKKLDHQISTDWSCCSLLEEYTTIKTLKTKGNLGYSQLFLIDTVEVGYKIDGVLR